MRSESDDSVERLSSALKSDPPFSVTQIYSLQMGGIVVGLRDSAWPGSKLGFGDRTEKSSIISAFGKFGRCRHE